MKDIIYLILLHLNLQCIAMERSEPFKLLRPFYINECRVTHVVIGRHYREKHASYMTDELVLELVESLDGKNFKPDSTSGGIEYYAADVEISVENKKNKLYRIVWLFEGNFLEIIGIINAYRVKKKRK